MLDSLLLTPNQEMTKTEVRQVAKRAHLICGGYPIGSAAGHDMDFVRIELLKHLYDAGYATTVANSFSDLDERITDRNLLVTYTAGPYAEADICEVLEDWLHDGGKWLALHGSSGGKAIRVGDQERRRKMQRLQHHSVLGAFFLNHPPIRKFNVLVKHRNHLIFKGIPEQFEVIDELYLIEPTVDAEILMTTELPKDPSPQGFGFVYDEDSSLLPDGKTRAIATRRSVGRGEVVYIALGHCHSGSSNSQPFVDPSAMNDGKSPATFRGVWELGIFNQLLVNAMNWGTAA